MVISVKRWVGVCACVALLAGCAGGASPLGVGDAAQSGGKRSFFGGPVVTPPEGYCFEDTNSQSRPQFFVILPCDDDSSTVTPAVITLQYGANGSAIVAENKAQLPEFLQSDEGRALLSASGEAETVSISDARVSGDVALVALKDSEASHTDVLSDREWRGFFDFRNRLVSVSVREYRARPLDTETASELLKLALSVARGGV